MKRLAEVLNMTEAPFTVEQAISAAANNAGIEAQDTLHKHNMIIPVADRPKVYQEILKVLKSYAVEKITKF